MIRIMSWISLLTALVLAALLVNPTSRAHAQYPPPSGNVTLTGSTTAAFGSTVPISLTVRDGRGSVVAGIACRMAIAKQPGTDASVSPISGTTDAGGVLRTNLFAGSTAGDIEVVATCGDLGANLVVHAGAVSPPGTGTGALARSDGDLAVALAVIGLLLILVGGLARAQGAKRSALDK